MGWVNCQKAYMTCYHTTSGWIILIIIIETLNVSVMAKFDSEKYANPVYSVGIYGGGNCLNGD